MIPHPLPSLPLAGMRMLCCAILDRVSEVTPKGQQTSESETELPFQRQVLHERERNFVKSFGDYMYIRINTGEEKIENPSLKYIICISTNYNKCSENQIAFFPRE